MANAQQQDNHNPTFTIDIHNYYDASMQLHIRLDSRLRMYRIYEVMRKRGWGEMDLVFEDRVVDQNDTPATLNLQEGSILYAVLLIDEDRDPVGPLSGRHTSPPQEEDFVELLFDRWDDDEPSTQIRLYRNTYLGHAFNALAHHWLRDMPEYTGLCYTFNGQYLSGVDTADSLNLSEVTHVQTCLFDFDQYEDRDELVGGIRDSSYLQTGWNAGPMLTIRVERWDGKAFSKFIMGGDEEFYTLQRMLTELWKKQVPEGQCVALAAPNGTTITCSDTPASLGLGDGDVIEASLTEQVRGQYIVPPRRLNGILRCGVCGTFAMACYGIS
jgi:hypothetical protein